MWPQLFTVQTAWLRLQSFRSAFASLCIDFEFPLFDQEESCKSFVVLKQTFSQNVRKLSRFQFVGICFSNLVRVVLFRRFFSKLHARRQVFSIVDLILQ